jgi:hydrogenase/urease accessory protein HupE
MSLVQLASAHDPGLSLATAKWDNQKLAIHLAMARSDVERLVELDAAEGFHLSDQQLNQIAHEAFIVTCGGQPSSPSKVCVRRDNRDGVQFDLLYPAVAPGELTVRSALLNQLPRGHRQFLSLLGESRVHLGERMLVAGQDSLTVQAHCGVTAKFTPHTVREFLGLGVAHILTGYDHLLFLLGLLMVAGTFRSALPIITSFTCAHSITLALATLDVVNVSPRITEPMIAASIVYVGLENLVCPAASRRWVLTFCFGLIHGFGFASVLRELGLGANGASVVAPLFSFNVGVEAGQLTIAALALPLIWKFRTSPALMRRFVPVGSVLVALAGTYWLLQRTLS